MGSIKLPTLHGEVTFEEAVDEEDDMLHRLAYWHHRNDFFSHLKAQRSQIEAIISYHLGLDTRDQCTLSEYEEWLHGSFNVAIPVRVHSRCKPTPQNVIIRFPLPYNIGESEFPGNADEELRSEAATYIWIEDNCPDVPIPCLYGFAFSNGCTFTAPGNAPFFPRWTHYIRQWLLILFKRSVPCLYVRRRKRFDLQIGYLLLDRIEKQDASMLTNTWQKYRHDKNHRSNLFKGLSKIILSLGRVPLPRIGSFTIGDDGIISLSNRPLTLRVHQAENENIATNMDRQLTYTSTDPYLMDMLSIYDNRLRYQPNAVTDAADARRQLAVLTCMRAVMHHYYSRDLRHGPFALALTDLSHSNIFVDDDWNVKHIIDLEWACSLPVEMQQPPYWLTDESIDHLTGDRLDAFNSIREEFMAAFEEAERHLNSSAKRSLVSAEIMRGGWESGKFFYYLALDGGTGIFNVFWDHIQRRFAGNQAVGDAFDHVFAPYWNTGSAAFIDAKIEEREHHIRNLRHTFENGMETG